METAEERVLRLLKDHPGIKPIPLLEKAITRRKYPSSVIRAAITKLVHGERIVMTAERKLFNIDNLDS